MNESVCTQAVQAIDWARWESPFPLSEPSKRTDQADREGAQLHNARDCTRHKGSCKDQMQEAESHVATFPVFSEVRQQRSWNNATPVI